MRDANYKLVREEYEGDAWKIIMCGILLNRTRCEQVKGIIRAFFRRWPVGEILPEDAIAPFMPNKKGSVKQDLEDQVKVKMFQVSSIREMRVGTKVKYVAPPPNVGVGVTM